MSLRPQPSYFDYSNDTKPTQSQTTTAKQPYNPPQSNDNSAQFQQNTSKPQKKEEEEDLITKTFKRAKKSVDHKINPDHIPRPKFYDEIYNDQSTKNSNFIASEGNLPPHSTAYFTVTETQNTSPRFIRSSLINLPLDQDTLLKSSLPFGLYVQPFAELHEQDSQIPQVSVVEDILRCSRCYTYINNKFTTKDKQSKKFLVCNCCNYEIDLGTNPHCKNEYFMTDFTGIPELSSPTVDYVAPPKFLLKTPFSPSYGIFLDVSSTSIEIGFASYILNSIQGSLDYFNNKSGTSIFIATYNDSHIHYYVPTASGDVKVVFVSDIDDPFCPIPREKLLINIEKDQSVIEKIIEKIQSIISNLTFGTGSKQSGSATGAAIKSGFEAFSGGAGGRIIIATCNPCNVGFANSKSRGDMKLMGTDNEKTLYSPHNDLITKIANDSNEKEKIVFDLFVVHNNEFDLVNLSQICTQTGGNSYYYSIDNSKDLSIKLEKLHYDLTRIFTRPNYYNVAFKLRASQEIDIIEINGVFGKKVGSAFSLAGTDPDSSLTFMCRIKENIKQNSKIHFQLAAIFTDNFNQRFLRIYNYSIFATSDNSSIFKGIDSDAFTKISINKSIVNTLTSTFTNSRKDLFDRLINCFYYYRETCSSHTSRGQLAMPENLKFYSIFVNSILKKPIFRNNKNLVSINTIISFINKTLNEPIYATIKQLYPKFYRVDDITSPYPEITQRLKIDTEIMLKNIGEMNETHGIIEKPYLHALSIERLCFNGAYLIDDSKYLNLFIFNETDSFFLNEIFQNESFEEIVNSGVESLDEANTNDLNVRLLNIINQIRSENKGIHQPLKISFINENAQLPDEFQSQLVEDPYKGESSYIDFLVEIHTAIGKKTSF